MAFDDADPADKSHTRTALLKYCEGDTLAMVEVRRALRVKLSREMGAGLLTSNARHVWWSRHC
jgi:hypothetical protein